MPQKVQSLLLQYLKEVRRIYGSHLKSVILYGSYARGDYTKDSDIDIMILVDLPDEKLDSYLDSLSELGFQYNVEHDYANSKEYRAFPILGFCLSFL